jgi:hypothetical protein
MDKTLEDQEFEEFKKRALELERQYLEDVKEMHAERRKYGIVDEFSGGTSYRITPSESREIRKLMVQ